MPVLSIADQRAQRATALLVGAVMRDARWSNNSTMRDVERSARSHGATACRLPIFEALVRRALLELPAPG
jgi:hypothetical protein